MFSTITFLIIALFNSNHWGTASFTRIDSSDNYRSQIKCLAFYLRDFAWLVNTKGEILHTKDGGKSWKIFPPSSDVKPLCLHFISELEGWTVGMDGQVMKTLDGGISWVNLYKLDKNKIDGRNIQQIKFVDNLLGWIIASPDYIFKTEDGGRSWVEIHYPDAMEIGASYFITPKEIWLACQNGSLIKTDDAGKNWKIVNIKSSIGRARNIFFLNKTVGWVAGYPDFGLYKTMDSGRTWQQMRSIEYPHKNETIESVFFLSDEEGWVVGQDKWQGNIKHKGVIMHTKNGGNTWEKVLVKENETIFTLIYFTTQKDGWLVDRDNLYKTDDKGNNWKLVLTLPPNQEIINDVIIKN